jgi:hypothetical protein
MIIKKSFILVMSVVFHCPAISTISVATSNFPKISPRKRNSATAPRQRSRSFGGGKQGAQDKSSDCQGLGDSIVDGHDGNGKVS